MIRLAVVDDHHFVRLGIQHHFAHRPDIHVTSATASVAALDEAGVEVDVLLLDLYLGTDHHPLDAIARWSRTAAVLVMSYSGRPSDVIASAQAGASGYLVKDALPEMFVAAVKEVAAGGFAWSPGLADIVQQWLSEPNGAARPTTPLSTRERETLRYLARGMTHKQVASRMDVAQSTVDTYVKRIRTKLDLGNKAELTRCAVEQGLLIEESP